MIRRLREATPLTKIAISLYGGDAVLVLRVLTSSAGRTGKEIGVGVAAALAVVIDPALLFYLRSRIGRTQAESENAG